MNYWDEMTDLENEIIRLDCLSSLVTVVCNGAESTARQSDIENTLWHIQGTIEDIKEKQYEKFQVLFDKLATQGVSTLRTNEYVQPSEASQELSKIINGWGQNV